MNTGSIGRYQIKAEIGRGGMATVYHAFDPQFQRDVAVKVLPPEFLHDPEFRRRFQREARAIARLEHPAIVPVYDFGDASGQLFLVMRLMNGGNLTSRMGHGPIPLAEIARIFTRLAQGLDSAHAQGIIHRDLKPDNILFDQWDEPHLADFGIVKLVESSQTALTATGGIVGTPAYMSPEQVRAIVDLDGRSDLYALGVILFEMLTGKQPYRAKTPMGQAFMHVNEPVPRVLDTNPGLPAACQEIIDQAMAKERSHRPNNASALAERVARLALPLEPPSIDSIPIVSTVSERTKEPQPDIDRALETLKEPLPFDEPGDVAIQAESTPQPSTKPDRTHDQEPAEEPSEIPAQWPQETELLAPSLQLESRSSPAPTTGRQPEPHVATPPAAGPGPSKRSRANLSRYLPWFAGLLLLTFLLIVAVNLTGDDTTAQEPETEAQPGEIAPEPDEQEPPQEAEVRQSELDQPPPPGKLLDSWLRPFDGKEMMFVPGGGFRMGSETGDSEAREDEFPQHLVRLDSFWIDKHETSNAQYELCVAAGVCTTTALTAGDHFGGEELPAAGVSWNDAQSYCSWVGAQLPSESQWEYAARGSKGLIYPWGDQTPDCRLTNYAGCDGVPVPALVGFEAGASWVGAVHMAGNVWEWVADWYQSDYYEHSAVANPEGPASGGGKVLRGGSWDSRAANLRGANRHGNDPSNRRLDYGFRCAIPLPEPSS